MPNFLLKLFSIFDPTLKSIVGELDIERKIDSSETQRIFNWTPKTHEEMILSTAESLVDLGLVSIK
jgi:dihydroflavonol-4-reductase